MNTMDFKELAQSIKQAGKIKRGKVNPNVA